MNEHADRDRTEPPPVILDRVTGKEATIYTPPEDRVELPFAVSHIFMLEPGDTGTPFLPAPVAIDTTITDPRVTAALDHAHDLTTGACIKNRHRVPCDTHRPEPDSVAFHLDPDIGAPAGPTLHREPDQDTPTTAPTDERAQRYRAALQSDYCGCGACEGQLTAVMAVADAEQAELLGEIERVDAERSTALTATTRDLNRTIDLLRAAERALSVERAKVAQAWDEGYRFGRLQQFDADYVKADGLIRHNHRTSLVRSLDYPTGACHDNPYRAALAGPEPEATEGGDDRG